MITENSLVDEMSEVSDRAPVRVMRSVVTPSPILEDVVWRRPSHKLGPRKIQQFTGEISDGTGIFVLHGEMNYHLAEVMTRQVTVSIEVWKNKYDTSRIVLEDVISNVHPRIALRFLVVEPIHWTIRVRSHSLLPLRYSLYIGHRRGVPTYLQQQLSDLHQKGIFASTYDRPFLGIQQLPSFQRERVFCALDRWPMMKGNSIINYPVNLAIEEMRRHSLYKAEAYRRGLIRPFLLFVSMPPDVRLQWAAQLGVPLVNTRFWGDSHQEAYAMLFKKRKGLQEQANYAFREKLSPLKIYECNWYQILYRVTHNATPRRSETRKEVKARKLKYEQSRTLCHDLDNQEILNMEELFINAVFETIINIYQEADPEQWEILKEQLYSPEIDRLMDNLLRSGFSGERNLRIIALHAMQEGKLGEPLFDALQSWIAKKHEGHELDSVRLILPVAVLGVQIALLITIALLTPMIVMPFALFTANSIAWVFKDTPGKLLSPVIGLCMQRIILGCHDVKIKDYYPPRSVLQEHHILPPDPFFELLNS